jgi:hypothetical protein
MLVMRAGPASPRGRRTGGQCGPSRLGGGLRHVRRGDAPRRGPVFTGARDKWRDAWHASDMALVRPGPHHGGVPDVATIQASGLQ